MGLKEAEARRDAGAVVEGLREWVENLAALNENAARQACAAPNVAVVDGRAYFDGDEPW